MNKPRRFCGWGCRADTALAQPAALQPRMSASDPKRKLSIPESGRSMCKIKSEPANKLAAAPLVECAQ